MALRKDRYEQVEVHLCEMCAAREAIHYSGVKFICHRCYIFVTWWA